MWTEGEEASSLQSSSTVPLLLLIAPAALAAPMSAEDSGEEVDHLVDSVHCSSFCQDFDNLTLSRAGEFGDSGEDFEVETHLIIS